MLAVGELKQVDYAVVPSVLILGDPPGAPLGAAARAAGARLLDSAPLASAVARLDRQIDADLVALALAEDGGDEMDRLLDRIEQAARRGRHRAVVVLPPALIDLAAARLSHADIWLLVEPDAVELAAAIALACTLRPRRAERLHDIGADGNAVRLVELTEEVSRIARHLAVLAGERERTVAAPLPPPSTERPVSAATIRAVIRARRVRDQFFRSDLFADPGWDILLDLAAARKQGRGVPVSSLCIAAAVPPTTALRWIRTLGEEGLLVRRADPGDRRRVFVTLSDEAAAAMDACLAAIVRTARFDQ